jgi:hypothetical protein
MKRTIIQPDLDLVSDWRTEEEMRELELKYPNQKRMYDNKGNKLSKQKIREPIIKVDRDIQMTAPECDTLGYYTGMLIFIIIMALITVLTIINGGIK